MDKYDELCENAAVVNPQLLAAAIRELEAKVGELDRAWKAQQFHLEAEERESDFQRERAERAEAALAECRAKLEVDPRTKYDGIATRDETIRLLESKLAEREAELCAMTAAFRGTEDRADKAEAERDAMRVCLEAPYNKDKLARFNAEAEVARLKGHAADAISMLEHLPSGSAEYAAALPIIAAYRAAYPKE